MAVLESLRSEKQWKRYSMNIILHRLSVFLIQYKHITLVLSFPITDADGIDDDGPGVKILVKDLDDVLVRDVGNRIKDSGK